MTSSSPACAARSSAASAFAGGRITVDEPLLRGRFGRLRTVVEGPDGDLYVLTSNRDGRGVPGARDDRILRVTPPHSDPPID